MRRKSALLLSLITHHLSPRKHLPRIEYAVGVERALDAAHGVDGRRVERQVEVGGLDVADAVLAADGAAEGDGQRESLFDGPAGACDGERVVSVAHEVDVDVAVAEVAEVDDEGRVPAARLLDPLDEFG